jgi:hypothetical protein
MPRPVSIRMRMATLAYETVQRVQQKYQDDPKYIVTIDEARMLEVVCRCEMILQNKRKAEDEEVEVDPKVISKLENYLPPKGSQSKDTSDDA